MVIFKPVLSRHRLKTVLSILHVCLYIYIYKDAMPYFAYVVVYPLTMTICRFVRVFSERLLAQFFVANDK